MTAPIHSAWRFLHPDFDASQGSRGLRITPTGRIDMVDGERSVRQSILLLLSTRPGERLMRPDYGCDLQQLVFNSNDDTTAGLAIHYVRRALERWEPRIDILRIDATQSSKDPSWLEITLDYRVRATLSPDQLVFTFDLMNSEA